MRKILAIATVTASTLLAAPAAQAQYFGVGFGPSKIDINCAGTTTCDTNDTGFKVYGGMMVAPPLALELTYFDWGKAQSTTGTTSSLQTDANGFGFGAAYFVTLGWGKCVARAGYARNKADTTVTLAAVTTSGSHSRNAPYAGFGCSWGFAGGWSLTAEYDTSRIKYTAADNANTHLLTIGVRW